MNDFSKKLNNTNAIVHLCKIGNFINYSLLAEGIAAASHKYNFSFKEVDIANLTKAEVQKPSVKLLIIVSEDTLDDQIIQTSIDLLKEEQYTTISFAFSYKTHENMLSYAKAIDLVKLKTNDHINFLRPDILTERGCFVSTQKIIDNSVCDSVRIKYSPLCRNDLPLDCPKYALDYFLKASRLYRDYKLFHRSASDGFFAIRDKVNASHFYITATKTYKDNFDLNRISKVLDYNKDTNELMYEGAYLPSSDSVEAFCVFKDNLTINTIIHTHASEKFTRNPDYTYKIKVPIASYGEYQTGLLVKKALRNEDDGFIIMEEHGEVFTNNSFEVSPILLSLL